MSSWDRDCDGVPDSRDRHVRDVHDADCDGIPNYRDRNYRDRHYDRRYSSRHDWQTYGYGGNHRWSIGAYLPREYYGSSYYIDYEPYGLERPHYGYRWDRVGNDAYLISTNNGLIIRVEYDVFR
jgi:Ni/Co efflux regulator RcnB